jgi:hypothetical protein
MSSNVVALRPPQNASESPLEAMLANLGHFRAERERDQRVLDRIVEASKTADAATKVDLFREAERLRASIRANTLDAQRCAEAAARYYHPTVTAVRVDVSKDPSAHSDAELIELVATKATDTELAILLAEEPA